MVPVAQWAALLLLLFTQNAFSEASPAFALFWPQQDCLIGGAGDLNLCVRADLKFESFSAMIDGHGEPRDNIISRSQQGELYLDLQAFWPWKERTVFAIQPRLSAPAQAGPTNGPMWTAVVRKVDITALLAPPEAEIRKHFPPTPVTTWYRTGEVSLDDYWCKKHGFTNPLSTIHRTVRFATVGQQPEQRLTCVVDLLQGIPDITPPLRRFHPLRGPGGGRMPAILTTPIQIQSPHRIPAQYYGVWMNGYRSQFLPDGRFVIHGVPVIERNGEAFVEITAARSSSVDTSRSATVDHNPGFKGVALLREPVGIPLSAPAERQFVRPAVSNAVWEVARAAQWAIGSPNFRNLGLLQSRLAVADRYTRALCQHTNNLTTPEKEAAQVMTNALFNIGNLLTVLSEDAEYRARSHLIGRPPHSARKLQGVVRNLGSYLAELDHESSVLAEPKVFAEVDAKIGGSTLPAFDRFTVPFTNDGSVLVYYLDLSRRVQRSDSYVIWAQKGVLKDGAEILPRCLLGNLFDPTGEPPSFWVDGVRSLEFVIFTRRVGRER